MRPKASVTRPCLRMDLSSREPSSSITRSPVLLPRAYRGTAYARPVSGHIRRRSHLFDMNPIQSFFRRTPLPAQLAPEPPKTRPLPLSTPKPVGAGDPTSDSRQTSPGRLAQLPKARSAAPSAQTLAARSQETQLAARIQKRLENPAVLDEVDPNVKTYAQGLSGDKRKEFLRLLNAGTENARKNDMSGLWLHNQNEKVNVPDPMGLRSNYYDSTKGRIDRAAVQRDIASTRKAIDQNSDYLKNGIPQSVCPGMSNSRAREVVQSRLEAGKAKLEALEQHDKWRFGLCREWADSNADALAATAPSKYSIERVEGQMKAFGLEWGDHNVVRVTDKESGQAFVFDSWRRSTQVSTEQDFNGSFRPVSCRTILP